LNKYISSFEELSSNEFWVCL